MPEKRNVVISVIIPVFNVENYIKQCLESLIHQTFEEIEIICVNDGSKDNSLQILQEFQKKDDRVIVVNQDNKGVATSRNAGLKIAKGEYISFVDSDDYIDVDEYKKLYDVAKKNNADIVSFSYKNVVGKGIVDKKRHSRFPFHVYENDSLSYYFEHGSVKVWNKFIRKSLIEENGIRFVDGMNFFEDPIFNMMVFAHARKSVSIPDALYYHRSRPPNSLSNRINRTQKMGFRLMGSKEVVVTWKKLNNTHKYKPQLLNYIFGGLTTDGVDKADVEKYYKRAIEDILSDNFFSDIDINILEKKAQERIYEISKYASNTTLPLQLPLTPKTTKISRVGEKGEL